MRFRSSSLSSMLGITRKKKRIKRQMGIYNNPLWKAAHAVPNAERRFKRRVGYYSGPMKWLRWFNRMTR
jgi:hypothetical protein